MSGATEEKKTYDRSTVQIFDKRQHEGPDGRRYCSYGGATCTQRPMKGYDFCVKHILQDPHAPFKQCDYVVLKNKLCANPVKMIDNDDPRYCNAHKQMLGLMPKGSGQYSKKKKQQKAAALKKGVKKEEQQQQRPTTSQVDIEESSGTDTDDDFKYNESHPDRPKRSKKRKFMGKSSKKSKTFHEDFFDNVDSATDSDVYTDDDDEVEEENASQYIDNNHFSTVRHNPAFLRQHMMHLAQAGVPVSNTEHYQEKHMVTKEEYLHMRKQRIEKLLVIYQRQHARLRRSLKEKYKNFILLKEQMLNTVADGESKINVQLKNVGSMFQAPVKPLFEFPEENSQIYSCEKVEKVDDNGVPLCSYAQCNSRRMLASDFCFQHILYDSNQRLYKAGPGGITDPILCATPSVLPKKEEGRKTVAIISSESGLPDFKPAFSTNEEQNSLMEMIEQYRKSVQTEEA